MKSDNNLLKGIAKNTGSNVKGVKSDNYYLRKIEENTKKGGSSGVAYDDTELIERIDSLEETSTEFATAINSISDMQENITRITIEQSNFRTSLGTKADKLDFDTLDVEIVYEDDSTDIKSLYCVKE